MIAAAAATAFAGCAAESNESADPTANEAELSCSNPDGTNAMIAALAVSIGREMHRWQVTTDLYIYRGANYQQMLGITGAGYAQCALTGSDGKSYPGCPNTAALLSFQDNTHDQQITFPGGQKLSAWTYASRLATGFVNQQTCDSRPDNHTGDNCPAEAHFLTQTGQAVGGCSMIDSFNATTPSGGALMEPGQLKNKLLWTAGNGPNPYIGFDAVGSTITIDPTGGLNDGDNTTSGSCSNSCNKTQLTNPTALAGTCCTCNGVTGSYQVSATNKYVYLCK
jgi:hypothetical protein